MKRENIARSPIAWLYWLLFAACAVVLVLLNLEFPGRPVQDPAALLNDPWYVLGFNYFGVLLVGVAALMTDDGRRRAMRWPFYVVPYFFIGVLVLSPFLARRPARELRDVPTPRILERRWIWWLALAAALLLILGLFPGGSPEQWAQTTLRNTGLGFMWLDIALNHILALPLAQADMRRRGVGRRGAWLAAIALTGPIGLSAYLARRPGNLYPAPAVPSPPE